MNSARKNKKYDVQWAAVGCWKHWTFEMPALHLYHAGGCHMPAKGRSLHVNGSACVCWINTHESTLIFMSQGSTPNGNHKTMATSSTIDVNTKSKYMKRYVDLPFIS